MTCLSLNFTENSSSSLLMINRKRSIIIVEALYQIAWSTAASIMVIVLLILMGGCETGHSDTPPRWDRMEGASHGPEPIFHFSP